MKATAKRTLTPRAVVLATAAAVALIGGTGAATAFADDDGGPAPQSSVQLPQNERHLDDTAKDRAQVKADKISQSQATAKALQTVPGTATSAELDHADRNGSLIWEVDVLGKDHKNHDITIDAGNGKVLNQHTDRDDDAAQDAAETQALLKTDKTGHDNATDQALKAVPGTVVSYSLDDNDHNGSTVWEIDVLGKDHKNHDITIDADSGKVLNQHTDQDDQDDHDDNDSDDD
ncbi:PepSY domain-containing protein [Streptomyces sp. Isolate_219]|uniref:PepSY domain-containing protein n=1 Tax=Streptomyces sp. Isolate_219 TaxID=2950110 RepID=UPI0021C8A9B4|nr:PepSY domain-containing protein [Streptomyces sp. Isolate_219]MCR8575504.1 PepSY domain-containing protein [Streptomyces sp. Isolate_219]